MVPYGVLLAVLVVLNSVSNAVARSKKDKMPTQPIKLYYLPPSPPCRAVMMAAKALDLELELVVTNLMEGAHLQPEFVKYEGIVWSCHRRQLENCRVYLLPLPPSPCQADMTVDKALDLELVVVVITEHYWCSVVVTNLMEEAHLHPGFVKMNPQHTIPTIDDSGFILWESRAILAYLVNAYGSRDDSLYPKNARQRALVDQRLNFDVGTLYNRYINLYGPMIFKGDPMDEALAAKLNEAIGWLNSMLEGKAFVAGDNLTIADISMIVTFTNLEAFEYDFSEYENVSKWFANMKKVLEPYGYTEIDKAGADMLASFLKNH